jgi:ribosomal protein L7/L12
MKLDRIKFARLIGAITNIANRTMSVDEIDCIDYLTEINVEPVSVPYADAAIVNDLLKAMKDGQKIAAIKAYRSLTGLGLKESKDAVEAQWSHTNCIDGQTLKQQMIDSLKMPDCMFQLETERNAVAEFIGSFSHYKN